MSLDYQSVMVFGIKIEKRDCVITKKALINECVCSKKTKPSATHKYCPKCGRNLQSPRTYEHVKFFDDTVDLYRDDLKVEGWPAFYDTSFDELYIGFYVKIGPYIDNTAERKDLPDMDKMPQFKASMEKAGLWDEESFGAWMVTRVT